jgi:hypothetical protein
MKIVRTTVVAMSLLCLGTQTLSAEPTTPGLHEPQTAPPTSTSSDAQPSGKPTPCPVVPTATATETSADSMRRAIERAAGYLGTHQLRADGAWMATQGAMLLGPGFKAWAKTLTVSPLVVEAAKEDPLAAFPQLLPIEGRLWALRTLPQRKTVALPKPPAAPLAGVELRHFEQQDAGDTLAIMLMSVACRNLSPTYRDRWLTLLSADRHSYVLAIQLFGLMLGYHQGCLNPGVTNPLRRQLATRLFSEMRADADALDDLAIERIAGLCYAGVCEWVDPQLISRLVTEQQPSGSWGRRDPHIPGAATTTEDHATARAFYVLARSWSVHHFPSNVAGPKPPRLK